MDVRNFVYELPVFFGKSGRPSGESTTAVPVWKTLETKADKVDIQFKGGTKEAVKERFLYVPVVTADGSLVLEVIDTEEEDARAAKDPPQRPRPDPVPHGTPHPSDPEPRRPPVRHDEPDPGPVKPWWK